jgi:hypothetical protein
MEAPRLRAYPGKTMIAEKFEAIVSLGELNSRMKDFYDLHEWLTKGEYDPALLEISIRNTFRVRRTVLTADHPLLSEAFAENEKRKGMWKTFLRKNNLALSLPFGEAVRLIREKLGTL